MRYKHVVITRHGGPDVLRIVEDELPIPNAGDVRLRILATGVAFTDVLIREGLYPGTPHVPFSPGYEAIALVDDVGDGVTNVHIGQRVAALTVTGSYSEYLCVPAAELVPVPEGIDAAEAACLVLHYITAYQLLHRVARVKLGDSILIHGAAGGVGTALLELGQLSGLTMYGTASLAKHPLVADLGGMPIDYHHEDVAARIHSLLGKGVDVVFDGIGGAHLWQSFRTLNPQGRLINYGFSSVLRAKRRQLKVALSFALLGLLNLISAGRKIHFYSIADSKKTTPSGFKTTSRSCFHC